MYQAAAFADGLQSRAVYQGSWALAIVGSTCPEGAVTCDASSLPTTGCCSSGETCFGSGGYYCCPTKDDCKTTVDNFPACFNNTWSLYQARSGIYYFCCPPGQYGVIPVGNYGGICQYNDVPVAASRSATLVEQVGTSSITRATRTSTTTSTRSDGAVVIVTQTVEGTPKAVGASPTSVSGQGNNNNANQNSNGTSSSNQGLSAGAIAGIVIGSLGVLALFLVAFMLYRRNSKKSKTEQAIGGPNGGTTESHAGGMQQANEPQYTAVSQQNHDNNYPIPATEMKSPALSAASPTSGYVHNQPYGNELPSSAYGNPGPYEAPVQPQWEGRAEMGSNRG
ncbi:hypothetical protein VTL71DRAFT_5186 [Oculimacula yallundae]|uniref:Uncharacterized protein n=1 Tax=Oculimacula yallundae TaxID=86028 RepID=A0ABR4C1J1_9HELO